MRVGLVSDIHGSAFALRLVMAELEGLGLDRVVCLGDAIQGGPEPAECVALLRESGWPVVMGNADDWLLRGVDEGFEEIRPEQEAVREWQLSRLSSADRSFIESFQPTVELECGEFRLLAFHGSPTHFNDLIFPETSAEELQRLLGDRPNTVCCGGHTHVQQLRRLGSTYYVNPGSIGFACSHLQLGELRADPWAEYAVVTFEGPAVSVAFRRVPFDPAAMRAVYLASDRPNKERAAAQYA